MSVLTSIGIGLISGMSISSLIMCFKLNSRLIELEFVIKLQEEKNKILENQHHQLLRKFEMELNKTGQPINCY